MHNPQAINWLASFPKSGNTWIRLMWQVYMTGCNNINLGMRPTEFDARYFDYQAVAPFNLKEVEDNYIWMLRPSVLLHMIARSITASLVVKTHTANVRVGTTRLIPLELTNSAVYLIRDPRDVAASYANHLGVSFDQVVTLMGRDDHVLGDTKLNSIPQVCAGWSDHVHSWRMANLVIRYEDLKEDPAKWFSQIVKLWDGKVDENRVDEAVEKTKLPELEKQEKTKGFKEANKGQFFGGDKGRLPRPQRKRIEKDHGSVMQQWGYL